MFGGGGVKHGTEYRKGKTRREFCKEIDNKVSGKRVERCREMVERR
jgi:hypothetical protein